VKSTHARAPVSVCVSNRLVCACAGTQGVVFAILLLVGVFVYVVGGMLFVYHKERIWAMPNRHFWKGLIGKCCK
jgi:hypothetical protein